MSTIEMRFLLREGFFLFLLFYAIATVFQLYLNNDMMHENRRRKAEPTLLLTQGIFNLLHHIDMAFDDAVSYTQLGNGLQQRLMLRQ